MGIKSCHQIVFKASSIVARELDAFLNHMISNNDFKNRPAAVKQKRIDCDISNIIHTLSYKHAKIFSSALVKDVAIFLKKLASETGFVVNAILDGNVRPQSKRDAFRRQYDSTMNRINSYYCQQAAMKIAAKPLDDLSAEERKRLDLYNKESKTLENASKMQIPVDFKEMLVQALEEVRAFTVDRESGGCVSRQIIKAEYEADYVIAHRFRTGQCELIFSTDSDMSALCGPSCISIRSFGETKKRKNGKDECVRNSFNISGGCNKLMNRLQSFIKSDFPHSKIKFEAAKYPLLQNTHPLTIALIVIGISCDVLPGGVIGITPKIIYDEMIKIEKEGIDDDKVKCVRLVKLFRQADKTKALKEVDIRTFCEAFLYQPALEFGKKNEPSSYKYVFNKPGTLSPYLKMFLPPGSKRIKDRGEILQCKGIDGVNLPHDFLKVENAFTCSSCNACFCGTCGYHPIKDRDGKRKKSKSFIHYENMDEPLCVDCYQQRIFLPGSTSMDDVFSLSEMKEYLKNNNQSVANDALAHEVQEMFEMVKESEVRCEIINDQVPYPVFPSKSLDCKDKSFSFGKYNHTFPLDRGG